MITAQLLQRFHSLPSSRRSKKQSGRSVFGGKFNFPICLLEKDVGHFHVTSSSCQSSPGKRSTFPSPRLRPCSPVLKCPFHIRSYPVFPHSRADSRKSLYHFIPAKVEPVLVVVPVLSANAAPSVHLGGFRLQPPTSKSTQLEQRSPAHSRELDSTLPSFTTLARRWPSAAPPKSQWLPGPERSDLGQNGALRRNRHRTVPASTRFSFPLV